MAMRRPRTGYRRRGLRDGVGFIWFTLIAMPFLMMSLAFATDFARLVMVGHEMRNVADAGAIAAAWQIEPGTVVLDEAKAVAAAQETVCVYSYYVDGVAANPNVTPIPNCSNPVSMRVTFDEENDDTLTAPGRGFRKVSVEVSYRVRDLIFPAYFGIGDRFVDGVAVKEAAVCVPGEADSFTGGFCARPVDRLSTDR